MAKVYLIGAGPGAVDLITVRGARLLAQANCVLYDALVSHEMLELCPNAVLVPVGKRCGLPSLSQSQINQQLLEAASLYDCVVRLKGGDPMLFGRADEEMQALIHANISFEVVPGVTAALAACADLKKPLTKRGVARAVKFVTPSTGDGEVTNDWLPGCIPQDTLVFYMGRRLGVQIAQALLAKGFDPATPVVSVANASYLSVNKHASTLAQLALGNWLWSDAPTLLMVGEVFAD